MAPTYLSGLIRRYQPARTLRSSSSYNLVHNPGNLVTAGDRAFSISGPYLWNQLPDTLKLPQTIESFKSGLKTHLYREAFEGVTS